MNKNLKKSNMSKILYTFIIVNLMFPTEMIYAAGIKLDQSVNKQYNSKIGKTKNGIDQIDIVNPKNGTSHNKFLEYNVNQRGVILNNSKGLIKTNLAGFIDGNANLTNNADLIITEITGTNRSDIEGFTEIAGQRADYVLANPNGVSLNGAGFINTDRVTISTGEIINDNNLMLQVKDGVIEVGSKGVSTEGVDYFTLLSRVAKLNGVISSNSKASVSKEIEILTGKNKYDYKNKKLTTINSTNDGKYNVAIDSSKLGGIMAGRIKLVGTEQGLGVNTSTLVAPESVEISAQGIIKTKDIKTKNLDINSKESELSGTIKANDISISGKSINSGNILADRVIAKIFESDGEVIVNETFIADELKNRDKFNSKSIDLETLDNAGTLSAETINLKGNSKNNSTIVANEITGKNFENNGSLQGNESLNLGDLVNKEKGTVLSKNIVTTKIINEGKVQANERLETGDVINKEKGTILSKNIVTANILNEGQIQADEKLETGNLINNKKIFAKDTLVKGNLTNVGRIDSNLEAQGENHLNTGIILGDKVKISSKLKNTGTLIGREGIELGTVINEKDILSNKNIVLESIENKTITSKLSGKNISSKTIKSSGIIHGNVTVDDLENKGNIKGATIKVTSKLFNSGKMISNDLDVTSETFLNEGTIGAKKITINSNSLLNRGNLISDILNMNVRNNIENSGAGYIKTENFTTTAKLNNSGSIFSKEINIRNVLKNSGLIKGNMEITNDLLENSGNLEGDIIRITSKSINNSKNILGDATYINGKLTNTETGVIGSKNLDITGDIDNTGQLISDDITLRSKTILNNGDIQAIKNITINSTNLINKKNILANENLNIESIVNNSGKISGKVKIRGGQNSATSVTNTGEISGSVDIKANVLKNTGGMITGDTVKIDYVADKNLDIEGTYFANNLEIKAKKSIDNLNNSLKALNDIKLTSHEGDIINDGKIIAGQDIVLTAKNIKNGTRRTGSETIENKGSLIESKRNLDIKGNYINTKYSTLMGGLGKTNLTMASDLINYGKIISRGNLETNSANFSNKGQVLAAKDLKIKATKIENNEDKLIYASINMTLDGETIENKMGTILTTDGDITLKATGNIANKANARRGGKIKAGNTLNITAKSYQNEGYKYKAGYFKNLYTVDQIQNLKTVSPNLITKTVNSQTRITAWQHYDFRTFFTIVNGGNLEEYKNQEWDGDYSYFAPVGDTQFYGIEGTVKINVIKTPIRVRQSTTEGKNINVELTEDFKNRGILTAENNIKIKAKNIINETEVVKTRGVSEYKGVTQARVIKTNLIDGDEKYTIAPRIENIKTKNYINISEDKARITAGGNIILDGNVKNTDTTNLESTSGVTSDLQDTIVKNKKVTLQKETKDTDKDSKQGDLSGIKDKLKNNEEEKINELNKEKTKAKEKTKTVEETVQKEKEKIVEETQTPKESAESEAKLIENQLETQKKLNIADYITVPRGNDGLFKKNSEFDKISNNKPLIETNIAFIDKSKYFGSSYFFKKIKYNPANIRTLGDSYYDTTLINDVLKRNFGRDKAVNEIATMKTLLDNASESHKKLGLKVGEKLTKEQLSNLEHDIVWYVEVEVDGHKVLAPQLYVAKKGLEVGPNSSSIDGKNITVKNGSLLNTGDINAQKIVNVDASQIINKNTVGKANIKGESVYLQAQKDIKNLGSTIEGTNVLLNAKDGDVINESLVEKNKLLNSENYTTDIIGVSKIKGQTINIKGNNYFQKGAILSGKDGSIDVKEKVTIEGLKLESRTKESGYKLVEVKVTNGKRMTGSGKEYTGTKYEKDVTATENVGSVVNFSGNLVMKAGSDINILGSEVKAKDALIQGKSINVEGVKDTNTSSYKTSKQEFAYSKDENIKKHTEKVLKSSITTKGDLTLVANDGDITFKGSSREAGGTIRSLAENGSVKDLTLETNNTYKRTATEIGINGTTLGESKEVIDARKKILDEDGVTKTKGTNAKLKHSSNAGIETDVDNLHSRGFITGTNHSEMYGNASATVGLVKSDINEEVNSILHERTTVKAKNEIILAKGDIIRESITGNITGDSTVKSLTGDIKYTTAKDIVTSNVKKDTYSIGSEYSYRVAPLDFAEKQKKRVDYSDNSSFSAKNAKKNGKSSPGEGAEALATIGGTGGDISKLATGEVASASVKTGVNVTKTEKKSYKSTALENELNIGGTQTLIGKNITLEG
ncbi:MAG: filamentous hemagglutinin N-terminal domain-containing protein, partial [Psychrilyobacter sp.]|uniref:two-partner secretion domain-containing protein n=1 Tax=Psychrilyobacter sp. TaxID=2586924 RepID=UPI003C729FCA